MGFDPDDRQLRLGDGMNLDELWSRAERDIHAFQSLVECAVENGQMPAQGFVNVVVPFVAHLLARHPLLGLDDGVSRLDSTSSTHTRALQARAVAFPRFADALLYNRGWAVVKTTDDLELVTSDLGWQFIPGAVPGEVFVPTSPKTALVIRGGGASYRHDEEVVDVPLWDWYPEDIDLRRRVMMLTAPKAVYAPSEATAQLARDLWAAPAEEPREHVDGERATPQSMANLASSAVAGMLHFDATGDPEVAFARMLAAQHRWGCECEETLEGIADPEQRRRARKRLHKAMAAAHKSLAHGSSHS